MQKHVAGPIFKTYYSARWICELKSCWLYYNVVSDKWNVPLSISSVGPFPQDKSYESLNPSEISVYTGNDPTLTVELDQSYDKKHIFIKVYNPLRC